MHFHLDPVGGIAGDMFVAAIIDLRPELAKALRETFELADFSSQVRIRLENFGDHALTGHRFVVAESTTAPVDSRARRRYRDIRALIEKAPLASAVQGRALAMFDLLAHAESRVHGLALDSVAFHEVGAWDSIVDIIAAAWLIEQLNSATWSCGALPLGSGQVQCAHGCLPVPAPATTVLLEGYPVFQDGIPGERITPTGAAILRHLNPSFALLRQTMRLSGSGTGFGSRNLDGISNVLRVLAFNPRELAIGREPIAVCEFEIDDQTPEDLAVALDHLRTAEGVLDAIQLSASTKKGRLGARIEVLVRPERLDEALERCFLETSTLGVRWRIVERAILDREMQTYRLFGREVRVKRSIRPGGVTTGKVEMDDLAPEAGGFAGREQARRRVQRLAVPDEDPEGG
jgi:uncharacterized protein (TIGR00299 family) protein